MWNLDGSAVADREAIKLTEKRLNVRSGYVDHSDDDRASRQGSPEGSDEDADDSHLTPKRESTAGDVRPAKYWSSTATKAKKIILQPLSTSKAWREPPFKAHSMRHSDSSQKMAKFPVNQTSEMESFAIARTT